ncbi:unnamed protein product, partial [marine sediment metagenome]
YLKRCLISNIMNTFAQYGPPKKYRPPQSEHIESHPTGAESQPVEPVTPPIVPTKEPGFLETLWSGFQSGRRMPGLSEEDAYRLWIDSRLSEVEWLAKYPGKTKRDYREWRQRAVPKEFNWFQKALIPKEIRERMKRRFR